MIRNRQIYYFQACSYNKQVRYVLMDIFLDKLEEITNWKDQMRAACKANQLNTALAGELTVLKLKILNERFKKIYDQQGKKIANVWIQNELKAFNWITIAISATENVRIQDFTQQQWNILEDIFKNKSTRRFLCEKITNNKNWSEQENECLRQILIDNKQQKIQWNDIARQLFQRSNQLYYRSAKHCREHWLNHLDPSKNRQAWTTQQDLQLVNSVQKLGKKWAELASILKRTQHAVKNRFNSLLAKQKKLHNGNSKQSFLINAIKASLVKVKRRTSNQSSVMRLRSFDSDKQMKAEPLVGFDFIDERRDMQQKDSSISEHELQAFEGMESLQHIVKQDQDQKPGKSQYQHVYSPFWAYSPKNITPNGFMNSPSPLSIYVGFNFINCSKQFTHTISLQNDTQQDRQKSDI